MITGIIMASGFSRRMKEDKLTLDIEGIKVIERVIQAAKDSLLDEIILVYRTDEVKLIGEKYNLKNIYNPNAHLGQSESVKLGVKESFYSAAYLFSVGDQPYLNSDVIDRLIKEHEKDVNSIIIPYYDNEFGMPLIFPSRFRDELLVVEGDQGGREIIRNNPSLVRRVNFENWKLGADIDRPKDIEAITKVEIVN